MGGKKKDVAIIQMRFRFNPDVGKDLKMGRLSWIIQVGPECNHTVFLERQRKIEYREKKGCLTGLASRACNA